MATTSTLYRFIASAGICAVSGAIAGAFVGGVFGLVRFVSPHVPIPLAVLLGVAFALSLLAWLVVLTIVGVFGNYGVRAIAGRALVTTGITGILTVMLANAAHAGLGGMLLGWVIGFLIGRALCAACAASERRAG
jgi:hypothetical protein